MNAKDNEQDMLNRPWPNRSASSSGFQPWQVIVRRRWQLVACLMLVCGVALAVSTLRKPNYEAAARVEVVTGQTRQTAGVSGLLARGASHDFTGQCELLQSREVLSRAVKKLNLAGRQWPGSNAGIERLRDSVSVRPVTGSRLIDIVGTSDNPATAASIANQLVAAFVETSAEQQKLMSGRLLDRLEEQIKLYEQQGNEQREALNEFRREHLITATDSSLSAIEDRVSSLEGELTAAKMATLALRTKAESLKAGLAGGQSPSNGAMLPEVQQDPTISSLRQRIDQYAQEEIQLAQAYLPGHQTLQAARARLANLREHLAEQGRLVMQSLYNQTSEQLERKAKHEQLLLGFLEQERKAGVELTERHGRYKQLLADVELTERFQSACVEQARHLKLDQHMNEPPVRIVDSAEAPNRPAGLGQAHQAASVLLLGLLFSIVFVFAMDHFASTPAEARQQVPPMYVPAGYVPMAGDFVPGWPGGYASPMSEPQAPESYESRDASEVRDDPEPTPHREHDAPETILGILTPMDLAGGNYDDMAFAARCRLVHTDPSCLQAETLREVHTSLLGRLGKGREAIVVTGPERSSGKTTCACNLAIMLAQSGRRVLLVDGNGEHSSLHLVFNNNSTVGLSDVLADVGLLNEALQETDINNLTVLHNSAGGQEVLGISDAGAVKKLNRRLAESFDWVIYDADTLESESSQALLQAVGKALLVTVGSDGLAGAVAQVELAGAVNVGCIENRHVCSGETTAQPETSGADNTS